MDMLVAEVETISMNIARMQFSKPCMHGEDHYGRAGLQLELAETLESTVNNFVFAFKKCSNFFLSTHL